MKVILIIIMMNGTVYNLGFNLMLNLHIIINTKIITIIDLRPVPSHNSLQTFLLPLYIPYDLIPLPPLL